MFLAFLYKDAFCSTYGSTLHILRRLHMSRQVAPHPFERDLSAYLLHDYALETEGCTG